MKWLRPFLLGLILGLMLLPASSAPTVSVACVSGCAGSAGTINNANSGQATSATNTSSVAWVYGYNGATWDQLQVDASKFLKVNCAAGCAGGTFNNNADAVATSATNGQSASWLYGFNGATWDRLQVDASKFLKVNVSAGTVAATQSGTWTVQPGNTANTTPWLAKLSDGTNAVAVKAASTAAVATDPALVVAVSPNNTIAATQSGTWTVQPGNTANTTPWVVGGNVTPADAAALGTTSIRTYSLGGLYNGTTVDLWREAINSTNSTGTGIAAAAQLGQCDNVTPTALTENSFGNAAIDCTNHTQLVGALVTTAAPTYTTGTSRGMSLTTNGGLRVSLADTAANTNPILVQAVGGTTNGLTMKTAVAAATTNATNVKASAGTVYHVEVYGNTATLSYLTLYNNAAAPTCGTGIVWEMAIPALTTGTSVVAPIPEGLAFSSGIGFCITTGIAGTGAVAANAAVVNIGYK